MNDAHLSVNVRAMMSRVINTYTINIKKNTNDKDRVERKERGVPSYFYFYCIHGIRRTRVCTVHGSIRWPLYHVERAAGNVCSVVLCGVTWLWLTQCGACTAICLYFVLRSLFRAVC